MASMAPPLFGRAEDKSEDQEQLLQLFWNRAQLKKEVDELRDQIFDLQEQLSKQRSRTQSVGQQLEHLEGLLANPEKSAAAVAYYQLRGIWESCHQRLADTAAELERAHLDKGRRLHEAAHQRRLVRSVEDVRAELQSVTEQTDRAAARVRALREQRSAHRGLWNFFRRRALTRKVNLQRSERRTLGRHAAELSEEIRARLGVSPPDYAGLRIDEKRTINLTMIAFAQELYLHYAERDLAKKARDAAVCKLADVKYGDGRECAAISKAVEDRLQQLAADQALQKRVQARVLWLQSRVCYRQGHDTVPDAATLGVIPLLRPDGREKGQVVVNVLADEYWDVFSVLLD